MYMIKEHCFIENKYLDFLDKEFTQSKNLESEELSQDKFDGFNSFVI